jgi:translation elongation factor EF-Tu-like GTPase
MLKIKAQIYLYKENGRKTPFESGYRPLFDFKGSSSRYSGKIDLINKRIFLPGEIDEVYITFANVDNLKVNYIFFFGEGLSRLGEGKVLAVVNNKE